MDAIRIGVIGTANTHAFQYVGLLNGWRADVPLPAALPDGRPSGIMQQAFGSHLREAARLYLENLNFDGATVTRLWGEASADAELIQRACGVQVVDDPADASREVDAVMVLTEDPQLHLPHSEPALRAGLPTFVDKPLAGDMTQAAAIAELADRHHAPWYSMSSLRCSPSLNALRLAVEEHYGGVQNAYIQCPARAPLYAIHAVEAMRVILGAFQVADVSAVQTPTRDVFVIDTVDGRAATLENNGAVERMSYTAVVQSRLREHLWVERDFGLVNAGFLRAFVEFARTGKPPVPPEEALASFELSLRVQQELARSAGSRD